MNTKLARSQMLKQQIRAWEVLDEKVLEVMESIPREFFVPKNFTDFAFADMEIPLPHDEYMMAPKIEGKLLQALEITKKDTVLEVGTGSGYLTACLAHMSKEVLSIDIYKDFLISAKEKLADQKIKNVNLSNLDIFETDQKNKYDVIVFTGSIKKFQRKFLNLLNPGGRIFVTIGELPIMESQIITSDSQNTLIQDKIFETCLPALKNQKFNKPFLL